MLEISPTWLSSINTLHRAALCASNTSSWKAPQFSHGGPTAYPAWPASFRPMKERDCQVSWAKGVRGRKSKSLLNLRKCLSTMSSDRPRFCGSWSSDSLGDLFKKKNWKRFLPQVVKSLLLMNTLPGSFAERSTFANEGPQSSSFTDFMANPPLLRSQEMVFLQRKELGSTPPPIT